VVLSVAGSRQFSSALIAMTNYFLSAVHLPSVILFCLVALFSTARAQQNLPQTQQEPDDVVRINTELVQTDVMVFDKQGRFVDGLKPEQFQLFVDGKQQAVSFFERVTTGSASEEAPLAAARGRSVSLEKATGVVPSDRGRVIYFFVDDMHMAPANLIRARKTILQFIDRQMGQNDQMAITSVSGQLGFLQQLTDNKTVLRRAAERLQLPVQGHGDLEFPPMSEVDAYAIIERREADVLAYFVDQLVKDGTPPSLAGDIVRNRARRILTQGHHLTRNTLATLENLARTSGQLPGRKVVFFISDGFLMNLTQSDTLGRLQNITNASARNGVVIYAFDARGLSTGGLDDATSPASFDPKGRMARVSMSALATTQEALQVLAEHTGGRALLNSNALGDDLVKVIRETSIYYLLAWRPSSENERSNKFRRIEVKVVGRPDLSVHVRRGYYDSEAKPPTKKDSAKEEVAASAKAPEAELSEAIGSAYPGNAFPTRLSLVYVDMPDKGTVLTASMQMAKQFITFNHSEGGQAAVVDLAGIVFDDKGKQVTRFRDRLAISLTSSSDDSLRRDLTYNFQTPLKPGLYQVRVAARDSQSGRAGSARQWIEIPDLSARRLSMSSLLLSENKDAEMQKAEATSIAKSAWSVDHRFARTSKLRFLTYIYNAARGADGAAPPDVALQVQISRDDQPVLTTTLRKVESGAQTDLDRLAYAAELPLEALPAGRYVLQVTVIDRIAKTSASQRASFEIE
jgi:VWFA-related protein